MAAPNKRKVIRIRCVGHFALPIDALVRLQGDLKELSEENEKKLQLILEREGFSFPIAVAFIGGEPYGILDGHQRHRVVARMLDKGYTLLDADGNEIRALPCVRVDCRDKQHAGRLILAAVSQFGKVTQGGLDGFLKSFAIDASVVKNFDIPDFDSAAFVAGREATERRPRDADESMTYRDITEGSDGMTKLRQYKDRIYEMRGRQKDVADQGFYVCLVFQSYAQKMAFCEQYQDVRVLYNLYMDGCGLAKKLGIPLPPVPGAEIKTSKLDKSLCAMTMEFSDGQ